MSPLVTTALTIGGTLAVYAAALALGRWLDPFLARLEAKRVLEERAQPPRATWEELP